MVDRDSFTHVPDIEVGGSPELVEDVKTPTKALDPSLVQAATSPDSHGAELLAGSLNVIAGMHGMPRPGGNVIGARGWCTDDRPTNFIDTD